jgi:hypothetical protein
MEWEESPDTPGLWKARIHLEGESFLYRNFHGERVTADLLINGNDWWLENAAVADESGQFRLTADSRDGGRSWRFSLDSTLDLLRALRGISNGTPVLPALATDSVQRLRLEGAWDTRQPPARQLSFIGEGQMGPFSWNGISVEGVSFRCSHQDGRWLFLDTEIQTATGLVRGKARGTWDSLVFRMGNGFVLPFPLSL